MRARSVLTHPRVEPLVSTALLARLVANPARFALGELAGTGRLVAYRLRASDTTVVLQHGTPDIEAFDELFYQQIYAPPPAVDAALGNVGRPLRILDIGANIGLFGAWARGRWPNAEIDAFEPDPRNAAVHRRTIALNSPQPPWRLHEVAATAADGELQFVIGRFAMSGPAAPGDSDATTLPARDVLPLMATADLIKIDAEGSEWEILDDPRFAATRARAVALEYHPDHCPEEDARTAAVHRLEAAGFEVRDAPTQAPAGYGSLWGWSR